MLPFIKQELLVLFVDSNSYHYLTVIILQQDLFGPFLYDYAALIYLFIYLFAVAHLSFWLGVTAEVQYPTKSFWLAS